MISYDRETKESRCGVQNRLPMLLLLDRAPREKPLEERSDLGKRKRDLNRVQRPLRVALARSMLQMRAMAFRMTWALLQLQA